MRGHSKRVVVCTESEELLMQGQVMSTNSKSELMPHNPRVRVMLRNLSARPVRMPAKAVIGEVSPCNVIPPIWKPEVGGEDEDPEQTWSSEMEDLFKQLGLDEPPEWMDQEGHSKG